MIGTRVLIDRCTVLMKWRPGDWMKWAFTEFQGRYHKSKNQNLEWINCGFFKISLIHEFTCTTPRTWFGHIYMFFWTKYKIKVNPQFSCYYHFSKREFIDHLMYLFSFSSADSQVKELKKEFMKGKGVPNLVSGFSFRICFVIQWNAEAWRCFKRVDVLIRHDQNWIITCINNL